MEIIDTIINGVNHNNTMTNLQQATRQVEEATNLLNEAKVNLERAQKKDYHVEDIEHILKSGILAGALVTKRVTDADVEDYRSNHYTIRTKANPDGSFWAFESLQEIFEVFPFVGIELLSDKTTYIHVRAN